METRYLLDTNIAIYFLKGRLTPKAAEFLKPVLKFKPDLSIITKIELLGRDQEYLTPLLRIPALDTILNSLQGTFSTLKKSMKKLD